MSGTDVKRLFGSVDLINGPILKSILTFSIPILISCIFQTLYVTVDTMVVSRIIGDDALASVGATSSVQDLLIGFGVGIGSGMGIVTGRCYGSGDREKLRRAVATSLIVCAFVSALLMLISSFFLRPLLVLLGTPAKILDNAYSYTNIMCMTVAVHLTYNLLSGLLRSIGNSVMPLVFLIVSSFLNIGFDFLFVAGFHMGVSGAAYATALVQLISVVLCAVYVLKYCRELLPEKRHFKPDKELYKEMISQGLAMGFMSSIVSAGTVVLQSTINGLGTKVIAGHTAARRLYGLQISPMTSVTAGYAAFVSQNRGANRCDRIRKGILYTNLVCVGWSLFLTVLMPFFSGNLVRFISGSSNKTVIDCATRYLIFSAPFYMVLGALINARYTLQAIGSKILPVVSSIIELVGKITFTIFIIPPLGYSGVIICEPIIWCLMLAELAVSYFKNEYLHPKSQISTALAN